MDISTLYNLALPLLLMGFFGYGFVYLAIKSLLLRNRINRHGVETKALVLHLREDTDSDGATCYQPILQYLTAEGREITVESEEGYYSRYDRKEGHYYKVRYLPEDPEKFKFSDSFPIVQWLGIVVGLAAVCACLYKFIQTLHGK